MTPADRRRALALAGVHLPPGWFPPPPSAPVWLPDVGAWVLPTPPSPPRPSDLSAALSSLEPADALYLLALLASRRAYVPR